MSDGLRLDLQGKRVAVIGFGRSGQSALRLLSALGARVAIADRKPESELAQVLSGVVASPVELFGNGQYEGALRGSDLALISPGVPMSLEPLQDARRTGIRLLGELEFASRYLTGRLIAITGTNGKSTTISLIGELLKNAGFDIFVGGNLGTPLADAALLSLQGRQWDFVVAEVSSFQLETIETFHPWIGAILNVTPDHLDRYPSFKDYAAAKARVFENQTADDYAILNADDAGLAIFRPFSLGRPVRFSRRETVTRGVFLQREMIMSNLREATEEVVPIADLRLRGVHNLENVMAATAVAVLAGCPMNTIRRTLQEFRGLEHVMEVVRVLRDVTYINDSKGTNVDATIKALESLPGPVILIAGGREKGEQYPGLVEAVQGKTKQVILIGEARTRFREMLKGAAPVSLAGTLADAVQQAASLARPGDTVLLSPVCASFDMFQDYKDRGRQFKERVNELA
ncbi:MAG TPA: UDP-N-acetylmuramoyl-L-alanine--D-glutamate ligase [Nitrospirales bacterium]